MLSLLNYRFAIILLLTQLIPVQIVGSTYAMFGLVP